MLRRHASRAVALAAVLMAVCSTAFGSVGPPKSADTASTYTPLPPVLGYASVGASSHTGARGYPRTTPEVTVTTPPGSAQYSAHVSISTRYRTVGSGKFYIALVVENRGASYHALVTPSRRLVVGGQSTATVEFFVPRLGPGRTYSFVPAVSGSKGRSAYINLYNVLTRVDLIPETQVRQNVPVS